jgi:hypothetical protein
MGDINEGDKSKILIYVVSTLIGLSAKLASMHKKHPLTFYTVIRQCCLTAMASWLVWWVCKKYDQDETSTYIFGCITASFSNQVIMIIWNWFKTGMNNILGNINETED